METPEQFVDSLNKKYFKLHKKYEEYFWVSYMWDHSVDNAKDAALAARDAFRSDPRNVTKIQALLPKANPKTKKRLLIWLDFFSRYQTPPEAINIKEEINTIESAIHRKLVTRKEGFIDPYTKKFIGASTSQMGTMVATHDDENIRKACFEAREKLAEDTVSEYITVVNLRNQYARTLGYTDFYDFKVQMEDGMTKKELFSIFDSIYEKTKFAKKNIIRLEKSMPGLRKPWNFTYMMAGDVTKEADRYFQFDQALLRWGQSFAGLGIDFKGGKLQLDLLDRKGKYSNGFCHWPELVRYENGKRYPGSANFTCNVVYGQVGSGSEGYETLFHEGGHAAHFLNVEQAEVCLRSEYSPMSAAWAETHSMFIDSIFESVEWRTRYAKDAAGTMYPFDLYQRELIKLQPIRPLALNGIIFVCNFEKEIYESSDLNREKVLAIARKNFAKYYERSEDSLMALNVPHIYSWESTASYHGYGLATLALHQWRDYFHNKYGYIVDNPKVGKEMAKVWKLGSAKKFKEYMVLATGKNLSPDAYLNQATAPIDELVTQAKERIQRLQKVRMSTKPIDLDASIRMVHGNKEVANNKKSFEDMSEKYGSWLRSLKP